MGFRLNGVADRIRTYDPRIRNPMLYPTELRRLLNISKYSDDYISKQITSKQSPKY
jgi:hypothetical protein